MNLLPMSSKIFPKWERSVVGDFTHLQRDMSEAFENFFKRTPLQGGSAFDLSFYPSIDLQSKEGKYLLKVELPGVREDEVSLEINHNTLTLRGEKKTEAKTGDGDYTQIERSFGSFRRDIRFDEDVDVEQVDAKLKDGVLLVEVKKKDSIKKNHRKIEIKKK